MYDMGIDLNKISISLELPGRVFIDDHACGLFERMNKRSKINCFVYKHYFFLPFCSGQLNQICVIPASSVAETAMTLNIMER